MLDWAVWVLTSTFLRFDRGFGLWFGSVVLGLREEFVASWLTTCWGFCKTLKYLGTSLRLIIFRLPVPRTIDVSSKCSLHTTVSVVGFQSSDPIILSHSALRFSDFGSLEKNTINKLKTGSNKDFGS